MFLLAFDFVDKKSVTFKSSCSLKSSIHVLAHLPTPPKTIATNTLLGGGFFFFPLFSPWKPSQGCWFFPMKNCYEASDVAKVDDMRKRACAPCKFFLSTAFFFSSFFFYSILRAITFYFGTCQKLNYIYCYISIYLLSSFLLNGFLTTAAIGLRRWSCATAAVVPSNDDLEDSYTVITL